jgi:hypothetical protein
MNVRFPSSSALELLLSHPIYRFFVALTVCVHHANLLFFFMDTVFDVVCGKKLQRSDFAENYMQDAPEYDFQSCIPRARHAIGRVIDPAQCTATARAGNVPSNRRYILSNYCGRPGPCLGVRR